MILMFILGLLVGCLVTTCAVYLLARKYGLVVLQCKLANVIHPKSDVPAVILKAERIKKNA